MNAINREIKIFKGEIDEKQKRELIVDMIYSLHRFGAMFTEYFLFDFPHLNTVGREAFITDKMRYVYCEILNPKDNICLFDQKDKTYSLFGKYFKREVLLLSDEKDFEKFVSFVGRHSVFIKKPIHGSCGRGIKLLSTNQHENVAKLFDNLIADGPCLVEQKVSNHHEIRRIYPKGLSTIRIPTIRTENGTEIFASIIRIGHGGSIVDNVGSGGIVAVVDIDSGIVETPGYDKKGNKYLIHPDTSELIVGFKVPFWEAAKTLAKELSEVVPSNRYVGWDLALTEDGWVMIEGNARGELYMQQFPNRIGIKDWLDSLMALSRILCK